MRAGDSVTESAAPHQCPFESVASSLIYADVCTFLNDVTGAWWLAAHSGEVFIPPNDPYIAFTVHSYAPYSFAGPSPSLHSYTPEDAAKATVTFKEIAAWAESKALAQIVLDEFGCTNQQQNRTARLLYYATTARAARQHGVGWVSGACLQECDESIRLRTSA